ncbi:hypothetical protein [Enterococcus thailandicus]|uniref:hypothetical protein n=1 Tax=Enterococcus thailandicus TaxID=417368 RepID=UPI0022E57F08|nr:hypothetical protein [Enterococcus thailandicus]
MEVNIFNKPSEMYNTLMTNSDTIIDRLNIIANDNLSNVLDTHWEKLLFTRFIDRKILDVLIDKQKSLATYDSSYVSVMDHVDYKAINNIKNDSLRKAKGATALLAFDTKWLRDHRKVEMEQVKQSVYVDGEIKQKYGFVKNNSKKLIVVFQSSWANTKEINKLKNTVSHELLQDLFKYKKYQFFQFAQRNKDYDFIFLEDEFNFVYGWFTTNYGHMIVENIQNFIRELYKEYNEINFVGASKGGYGAYHIGKDLDFVKSITLIAPIIDVISYSQKVNNQTILGELSDGREDLLKKIIDRQNVEPINPSRIYMTTGESDYNYKQMIQLLEKHPGLNLNFTDKSYDHNDVILHTYKSALSENLGLI